MVKFHNVQYIVYRIVRELFMIIKTISLVVMAQRYFLKYKHPCIQQLFVDNGYFLLFHSVVAVYVSFLFHLLGSVG
jgi:hypothetical protein